MRQIVLDTETTGLSTKDGHRIIEFAAIELNNRFPTGEQLHFYFNPEREVDAGAQQVHGLSLAMLADKPKFADLAQTIIDFIQDSELIIHNASFDVGFLNYEFDRADKKYKQVKDYACIFDTLKYARKKHTGQANSLDALCRRYKIDNSSRTLHGALLDTQLLLEVYLTMTGEQMSLFAADISLEQTHLSTVQKPTQKSRQALPVIPASDAEMKAHAEYLADIAE